MATYLWVIATHKHGSQAEVSEGYKGMQAYFPRKFGQILKCGYYKKLGLIKNNWTIHKSAENKY